MLQSYKMQSCNVAILQCCNVEVAKFAKCNFKLGCYALTHESIEIKVPEVSLQLQTEIG